MKRTYFYITLVFAMLFMVSCENDETKMTVLPPSEVNAPEITLEGSSNYVTEEATVKLYPSVLSWTRTNLGSLEIPVTYTLQIDTVPDFSSKKQESLGIGTRSYSISGAELNNWGIKFNKDTKNLKQVDLFIRVAASVYVKEESIINKPDSAYSDAVVIAVTPMLLETPFIYVPGNHQGVNGAKDWDPETAPHLYSPLRDNVYTGYVYLSGGFKFTLLPQWKDGSNYGVGSAPKTLSNDNNAGNLEAAPGYYFVEANIGKLTYSIGDPVTWTIIGDARGGWGESNEVKLTYNTAKGVLTTTTTLVPGEFKFRRDNKWDVTLGVGPEEGLLTLGAGNLNFTGAAGTYNITLDLSTEPAKYNYTITKVE